MWVAHSAKKSILWWVWAKTFFRVVCGFIFLAFFRTKFFWGFGAHLKCISHQAFKPANKKGDVFHSFQICIVLTLSCVGIKKRNDSFFPGICNLHNLEFPDHSYSENFSTPTPCLPIFPHSHSLTFWQSQRNKSHFPFSQIHLHSAQGQAYKIMQ